MGGGAKGLTALNGSTNSATITREYRFAVKVSICNNLPSKENYCTADEGPPALGTAGSSSK